MYSKPGYVKVALAERPRVFIPSPRLVPGMTQRLPARWQPLGRFILPYSGAARRIVKAVSDYTWTFNIRNFPSNPNPGDDIFVDVEGQVNDIMAGFPDRWQAWLAAAVVDAAGNIDVTRFATNWMPSNTHGTYPYATTIRISDLGNPLWSHLVLGPGTMPNQKITVEVRLYAKHDDTPDWDWSLW